MIHRCTACPVNLYFGLHFLKLAVIYFLNNKNNYQKNCTNSIFPNFIYKILIYSNGLK